MAAEPKQFPIVFGYPYYYIYSKMQQNMVTFTIVMVSALWIRLAFEDGKSSYFVYTMNTGNLYPVVKDKSHFMTFNGKPYF